MCTRIQQNTNVNINMGLNAINNNYRMMTVFVSKDDYILYFIKIGSTFLYTQIPNIPHTCYKQVALHTKSSTFYFLTVPNLYNLYNLLIYIVLHIITTLVVRMLQLITIYYVFILTFIVNTL